MGEMKPDLAVTAKEIRERVSGLRRWADRDPEQAHAVEDAIHVEALDEIAHGHVDDPQAVAQAALRTLDVDFPRWMA